MTLEVYGIKNCDTVRKALKWLDANQLTYQFHDFKKEKLTTELVAQWLDKVDISLLINKRGTTWRKLDDDSKAITDTNALIQLIIENPSLIKRPLVTYKGNSSVGFKADDWQQKYL